MKPLLSFHNDASIKAKYLTRLTLHRAADEIVQGTGGFDTETNKGCAVGCTLDNYSHKGYETELGIPRVLAYLEDRLFERLPGEEAKDFPIAFLSAIPVGKDLSKVSTHFFIWLLTDKEDGVIKFATKDTTKKAIQDVADLLQKSLTEEVTADQFRVVRRAAAAAYAAAYAADAAADAAAYAAYAAAAYDAAYAAAYDAAYAAADARKKHYTKMAAKLIELLAAA